MGKALTIDVDGHRVLTRALVRWTPIALDCYKRNCNCRNCNLVPPNSFHEKCNVKYYVKGYFIVGNYPPKK